MPTIFHIKPSPRDVTGRHLPRAAESAAKVFRTRFGAGVIVAYAGSSRSPAISITATLKESVESVDIGAELTKSLRMLTKTVIDVRNESPKIRGQMTTIYGAKHLPADLGAKIDGHSLHLNAGLGSAKGIKALRSLALGCEPVELVGFSLPSLSAGQSFKQLFATERRAGFTPVPMTGMLTGHQHGPKQSGLLKLWDGEDLAIIHTPGDKVLEVMKGYRPGRQAVATVRVDRDLIFDEPRYTFVAWEWLGSQDELFEPTAT